MPNRPAAPERDGAAVSRPRRGLAGVLPRLRRLGARALRWGVRAVLILAAASVLWVAVYRFIDPPATLYMLQEWRRLGAIAHENRPLAAISAWMPRAAVAAEDAGFCSHWGFDFAAIREALSDTGRLRGGSTISQQVAKNAFLWQGRSWTRKGLEAGFTLLIELIWPKRRIVEVYLNIVEFDAGVFGVAAAARHYFGVDAEKLSPRQAALLAALLPDPKGWSAKRPTAYLSRRARRIADGAATILKDGRSACFEMPAPPDRG